MDAHHHAELRAVYRAIALTPIGREDALVDRVLALVRAHGGVLSLHTLMTGTEQDTLLHALARRGRRAALRAVLQHRPHQEDALPARWSDAPNAAGETPLQLAVSRHLAHGGSLHDVAGVVAEFADGGDPHASLYATHTARALVQSRILQHEYGLADLDALGLHVRGRPLLHAFLRAVARRPPEQGGFRPHLAFAQRLFDAFEADPLERDALTGQTALEVLLPEASTSIPGADAMVELVHDATDDAAVPARALAVAMGLHARLGAGSALRALDDEVLRGFILTPRLFTAPRRSVRDRRLERLRALADAERLGVYADRELRARFLEHGAPLDAPAFRRAHFLLATFAVVGRDHARYPDLCAALERGGFDFSAPLTPAYSARARAALLGE